MSLRGKPLLRPTAVNQRSSGHRADYTVPTRGPATGSIMSAPMEASFATWPGSTRVKPGHEVIQGRFGFYAGSRGHAQE